MSISFNHHFNIDIATIDDHELRMIIDLFAYQTNLISRTRLNEIFHQICIFGKPKMLKYILEMGIHETQPLYRKGLCLEISFQNDWRPIHYICNYSTPKMIKYIIDRGVDVNVKTNNGIQPIHLLCRHSTPEMIKYIIDHGSDLEAIDQMNWKPVHLIAKYSTPTLLKYIINKGVDLETSIFNDWKLIHLVCQYSNSEMIKYMIDVSPNLKVKDSCKNQPIHLIFQYGESEAIRHIIDAYQSNGHNFSPINIDRKKPIHYLIERNLMDEIEYMMDHGYDLDSHNSAQDRFDIRYAIKEKYAPGGQGYLDAMKSFESNL
jgi:ankyrin repeat protein